MDARDPGMSFKPPAITSRESIRSRCTALVACAPYTSAVPKVTLRLRRDDGWAGISLVDLERCSPTVLSLSVLVAPCMLTLRFTGRPTTPGVGISGSGHEGLTALPQRGKPLQDHELKETTIRTRINAQLRPNEQAWQPASLIDLSPLRRLDRRMSSCCFEPPRMIQRRLSAPFPSRRPNPHVELLRVDERL